MLTEFLSTASVHSWLRKLYWNRPEFKNTTNFVHIKTGYYWSIKVRKYVLDELCHDEELSLLGEPDEGSSSWTDPEHLAFELVLTVHASKISEPDIDKMYPY